MGVEPAQCERAGVKTDALLRLFYTRLVAGSTNHDGRGRLAPPVVNRKLWTASIARVGFAEDLCDLGALLVDGDGEGGVALAVTGVDSGALV